MVLLLVEWTHEQKCTTASCLHWIFFFLFKYCQDACSLHDECLFKPQVSSLKKLCFRLFRDWHHKESGIPSGGCFDESKQIYVSYRDKTYFLTSEGCVAIVSWESNPDEQGNESSHSLGTLVNMQIMFAHSICIDLYILYRPTRQSIHMNVFMTQ